MPGAYGYPLPSRILGFSGVRPQPRLMSPLKNSCSPVISAPIVIISLLSPALQLTCGERSFTKLVMWSWSSPPGHGPSGPLPNMNRYLLG